MNINFSALNEFRNLEIQNNKAILANVGGDRYSSVSTYKGPLSAMVRTEGERLVNNNMRENLMDALADAFGMKNEVSTVDGKKQYSTTLIDTLEKHLGKDFKREDFGFKGGTVTSGRPLTMRRVTAILNKLENVNFNISAHEKLLNQALAKLDSMDSKSPEFATQAKMIQDATKLLQALKNDAKGEPIVSFLGMLEEYSVKDTTREDGQIITTRNLSTLEGHVINQLGIPVTLQMPDISENHEPSEELAHKLNSIVMDEADKQLTQLLEELKKL